MESVSDDEIEDANEQSPFIVKLKEICDNLRALSSSGDSLINRLEEGTSASSIFKQSVVRNFLQLLNTATKEELKAIKGIGERASFIIELREESPQPFKSLDDLQNIGLSEKQVKNILRNVNEAFF